MCGEKDFVEMINGFKPLIVAPKGSVLDVSLSSKYTHYEIHGRRLLEEWNYDLLCIANHLHFVLCFL